MKKLLITAVLSYFRFFAKAALTRNKPIIIGITGSVGKSSARDMLHAILKDHFPTKVVAQNSEIGLPLGILGLKPKSLGFETPLKSVIDWLYLCVFAPFRLNNLKGIKYLIVEMGIDEPYPPKNMEYLLTIVKPDIAVLLNARPVHLMQFEKLLQTESRSFKNEKEKVEFLINKIAEEKIKIITESGCKIGIYNRDNKHIAGLIGQWSNGHKIPLLTFGDDKSNPISYENYEISIKGTTFVFNYDNNALTVSTPHFLLPEKYRETIAAVLLAALQTGLSLKQIVSSLQKNFSLPKSRAGILQGIKNSLIIDSSYNASRPAVEGMLDLLLELKKQTKRPTVFLMGDMRELGEESKIEHEKVAEKLIGIVDYLYCVGALTRQYIVPTFNLELITYNLKEVRWFDTSLRAGEYLHDNLPKDSLVLVKGSQNTIYLEDAIKLILKNKSDEKLLCRQEDYWLEKKAKYTRINLPQAD